MMKSSSQWCRLMWGAWHYSVQAIKSVSGLPKKLLMSPFQVVTLLWHFKVKAFIVTSMMVTGFMMGLIAEEYDVGLLSPDSLELFSVPTETVRFFKEQGEALALRPLTPEEQQWAALPPERLSSEQINRLKQAVFSQKNREGIKAYPEFTVNRWGSERMILTAMDLHHLRTIAFEVGDEAQEQVSALQKEHDRHWNAWYEEKRALRARLREVTLDRLKEITSAPGPEAVDLMRRSGGAGATNSNHRRWREDQRLSETRQLEAKLAEPYSNSVDLVKAKQWDSEVELKRKQLTELHGSALFHLKIKGSTLMAHQLGILSVSSEKGLKGKLSEPDLQAVVMTHFKSSTPHYLVMTIVMSSYIIALMGFLYVLPTCFRALRNMMVKVSDQLIEKGVEGEALRLSKHEQMELMKNVRGMKDSPQSSKRL